MQPTDIDDPEYFHRVVDCQWACPTHTPVPQYIRLIALGRYTDAYMLNWESNVFPGILGRTCDRPCEPACRRGRIEAQPVAICRLKRVAADYKGEIDDRLPRRPAAPNGKRVACVGAGPAALTVARDLLPLGYSVTLFDREMRGGGMIRSQIPAFRLPEAVINEEVGRILDLGAETRFGQDVTSLKGLLDQGFDAVFVGTGAPKGRELDIPGRRETGANIHIGIDWLSSVAFGHTSRIGKRVVVLGGGNTAMDCCRTARRLGADSVTVVVRSPFEEMKASPWEIEDARSEDIPILNNHVPKACIVRQGRLVGIRFEKVRREVGPDGRRLLVPTGEPPVDLDCDDILVAIGQENAFPWIERDLIDFDETGMPVVDRVTFQSSRAEIFFGGDAAFGPENIITAVAHGHQAAISIHHHCRGEPVGDRPPPGHTLISTRMGVHEWAYHNDVSADGRHKVPHADKVAALADRLMEVELGFVPEVGYSEAMRCLNCDVQTVFARELCIECDACVDVCPMDCINFIDNGPEPELRERLRAPAPLAGQALYTSGSVKTGRVMVKDENVCLHCGLCAERCPTAAWDMMASNYHVTQAGEPCAR